MRDFAPPARTLAAEAFGSRDDSASFDFLSGALLASRLTRSSASLRTFSSHRGGRTSASAPGLLLVFAPGPFSISLRMRLLGSRSRLLRLDDRAA